ncbi:MAG: inositol-1-monophosphatase [Gammaproteobacteria bacterium]|nr:inositol-1-monophosphatase [Gammaproteobacteria bacterium]MBL6998694.1 inositol-1-monophosphatase [Gammaproteobacteria bacterium]
MQPMLNIAVRAAHAAGDYISRQVNNIPNLEIEQKSPNDFVTHVDRQAEQRIIETLLKAFPDHSILAEESGQQGDSEYQWIIDPLDGTTNFLHGFPHFAVSIALVHNGKMEQAVIYDPMKQELFTASKGAGATLNNRRIRVTRPVSIQGALLGTGFPFRAKQHLPAFQSMFADFFMQAGDIRRAGSAALDLAYVAAGRLDAYWEIGLKPWDMAAGALIIREAGGLVGDFSGNENYLETGNIVAGNPRIFADLIRKLQPHLSSDLKA